MLIQADRGQASRQSTDLELSSFTVTKLQCYYSNTNAFQLALLGKACCKICVGGTKFGADPYY